MRPVIDELSASPATIRDLQRRLADHGLVWLYAQRVPYGNFHSDRVKEQVYLPD
ncbi:MAG: hypothetical protein U0872_06465 [Planctomycetaceae bacterium]